MENCENKFYYIYDDYTHNMVYNVQEELNKNKKFFVPYLIKLLENKGHTYEFLDESKIDKNDKNYNKNNENILNDIFNAKDVEEDEYDSIDRYFELKRKSLATREDKMIIEKYLFKKNWNIDSFYVNYDEIIKAQNLNNFDVNIYKKSKEFVNKYNHVIFDNLDNFDISKFNKDDKKIIDVEFFNKYFKKTYVLKNLRNLLSKQPPSISVFDESTDDLLINFNSASFNCKKELLLLIISKLTFNVNNLNIVIPRDKLLDKLKEISEDKDIFGNKQNRLLFGFTDIIANNTRKFLGFLNSLFHNYGLCIKKIDKVSYDNELKGNIHNYTYQLSYYDIFYKFL